MVTSVTGNVDNLLTGRSVALGSLAPLDTAAPVVTVAPRDPGLLPAGTDDLNRLRDMNGIAFDALYRSTQLDALRQLSTIYRDYIQNGDDDSLRAIAQRELPKINHRIAELGRI